MVRMSELTLLARTLQSGKGMTVGLDLINEI